MSRPFRLALLALAASSAFLPAVAQVAPPSIAPFSNLSELPLQSMHFQDVTVRRYLRDVRQGGTEAGAQAVAYGSDRHSAMWFTGDAHTGDLGGAVNRYQTQYDDYGFTGGVDLRMARGTLLGLYGGYDTGQARLTPFSQKSDAKTWFAGGYGSATVGPVYIDAHGAYGETHFRTRRTLADGFGGGVQYTDDGGKPHSYQFGGAATAGISQDFRGVEVEPYVGAKYANVKREAFSEGTATGALSLPRLQTDSLESIAGLRLGLKIPLAGTSTVVRPSVRGEYRHEFESAGRGRFLNATFADGAGGQLADPFVATALPHDYAAVGAGLTISGASPFSIVIDYSGEIASQRDIHGLTGGFHLAF